MTFRRYVQEMWFQHKDEIEYWEHKNPDYDATEYFKRFKWWLRIEYRKQYPYGI